LITSELGIQIAVVPEIVANVRWAGGQQRRLSRRLLLPFHSVHVNGSAADTQNKTPPTRCFLLLVCSQLNCSYRGNGWVSRRNNNHKGQKLHSQREREDDASFMLLKINSEPEVTHHHTYQLYWIGSDQSQSSVSELDEHGMHAWPIC
jgi:hypothetical protein